MAQSLQNNSVNVLQVGMDLDSLPDNIRQGFYRYALNVVNTNTENNIALTNENKFTEEITGAINSSSVIIGTAFIKDGEFLVVAVNKTTRVTEFYIVDIENKTTNLICNTSEEFYNELSTVDIVVRKKLGKYYAYIAGQDKRALKIDIYNCSGTVNIEDITIEKEYSFPVLNLSVTNDGNLPPGSYSIAIRYLDSNENYTNWIITSNTVNITSYQENSKINYFYGSIANSEDRALREMLEYIKTNKSINVSVTNVDKSYSYYQLGIIASINGFNAADSFYITEPITTETETYKIYTLDNYIKGDLSEVLFNKVTIDGTSYIDIFNDRLVIGNIRYKKTDDKSFQLLASKIKSEVVTKDILIEKADSGYSSKNEVYLGGGFTPGEVYAFGIVYIFADGSLSQVYHIPAPDNNYGFKAWTLQQQYDSWYGTDYDGNNLESTQVRLHQFPYRDEIEHFSITIYRRYDITYVLANANDSNFTISNSKITFADGSYVTNPYHTKDCYTKQLPDGTTETFCYVKFTVYSYNTSGIERIEFDVTYSDNTTEHIDTTNFTLNTQDLERDTLAKIAGIKLSNIQLPEGAIGYIIVYDKKNENNRRIIDHGYAQKANYSYDIKTIAYTYPDNTYNNSTTDYYIAVHAPYYMYRKGVIKPSKIRIVGELLANRTVKRHNVVEDVVDGSSAQGYFSGLIKSDNDGMDFSSSVVFNNTRQVYSTGAGTEIDVVDAYYLRQGETVNVDQYEIANLSLDDQIVIMKLSSQFPTSPSGSQWTGVLYNIALINDTIVYNTLDEIEYIPLAYNISGDSEIEIWRSDNYISLWSFSSSIYYNTFAPVKREIAEDVSNVIGHFVMKFVNATEAVIGAFTGNTQLIYNAVSNEIKNTLGLALDIFNMSYRRIEEDSNIRALVKHGAINETNDYYDDTIVFHAETFVGLPIDSRFNNQLRLRVKEGTNFFFGEDVKDYVKYIESKYLVKDDGRDQITNNDGSVKKRTLTLKYIPNPELYLYNESYLRVNDYKVFLPFTGENVVDFGNRIVWSLPDAKESKTDGFLSFLALNYKDIDDDITGLKTFNNQLYVWTKKKLYKFPRPFQEKLTNEMQLYIGTGSFLSIGPFETVDDDIQSYGTIYSNTITKFKGVLFYISTEGYPIMVTNKMDNLAQKGIIKWLKKTRDFNVKRQWKDKYSSDYPNYNPYHEQGIGYIVGYDDINTRILVTQKDYNIADANWYWNNNDNMIIATGIDDIGYTISFSLLSGQWISFHDYLPSIYLWNYNLFCYINANNVYILNTDLYNNNFVVELVTRREPLLEKIWEDIVMQIDIYDERNIKVYNDFFDYITFYTEEQISLRHQIDVETENSNFLWNNIVNNYNVKAKNIEDKWRINNIRDYRTEFTDPTFAFTIYPKYAVKQLFYGNTAKSWRSVNPIRSRYLYVRLERNRNNDDYTKFVINPIVSKYTYSIN